jgi:hypothetical protein
MSIQAVSQSTAQTTHAPAASTSGSTSAASVSGTNPSSASSGSAAAQPAASYTVSISSAARSMLAEARETSVQTAQEAGKGDQQAQRLLAREAAAKAG